jgi:hypothetical protein
MFSSRSSLTPIRLLKIPFGITPKTDVENALSSSGDLTKDPLVIRTVWKETKLKLYENQVGRLYPSDWTLLNDSRQNFSAIHYKKIEPWNRIDTLQHVTVVNILQLHDLAIVFGNFFFVPHRDVNAVLS